LLRNVKKIVKFGVRIMPFQTGDDAGEDEEQEEFSTITDEQKSSWAPIDGLTGRRERVRSNADVIVEHSSNLTHTFKGTDR
jgi:hypothetical protein